MPSSLPTPAWLSTCPDVGADNGYPAHVKIERWLTDLIACGELVPGDRLPRENDLAVMIGVSRMTLRQALATMESHGTLKRTTGRAGGTFITEPRVDCDLTGLAGFTEQLRRSNQRAGARVIIARTVPATAKAADALSIGRGALVHEVVRVRTAQRKPLALERSYFPAARLPDLLEHKLTSSLYELLTAKYGQKPHMARENLEPVIARSEEADLLDVNVGAPLMLVERTAYTAAGVAVEYAQDLFRPDRVKITLQTGIGNAQRPADLTVVKDYSGPRARYVSSPVRR